MTKYLPLRDVAIFGIFIFACGTGLWACGTSKESEGTKAPAPHFRRAEKAVEEKGTLTLKGEGLKLTPVMQGRKINSLTQAEGAEKYLKLQKKFALPIQFNGWMTLDRVEHNYLKCAQAISKEPSFFLEDDHHGSVPIQPGEKIPLSLEKLYVVHVEFENVSACNSVDIQFGVFYGTDEGAN
ncbi:MAG TPA: hypothetical protein VIG33_09965 [Pseudobdellovibrionaceae bacterium]|jgi:hypothetical protein